MTSDIDAESLSTDNFSIDEGAYIESASVNPDDSKIIDLKLGGIKPNKSYSIELKDIFNKLNISLSDCISLKTSDGFDCKGIMLNDSENGNVKNGDNNFHLPELEFHLFLEPCTLPHKLYLHAPGSRIHFLIPLRRRNYQQILSFAHPSDEVLL